MGTKAETAIRQRDMIMATIICVLTLCPYRFALCYRNRWTQAKEV